MIFSRKHRRSSKNLPIIPDQSAQKATQEFTKDTKCHRLMIQFEEEMKIIKDDKKLHPEKYKRAKKDSRADILGIIDAPMSDNAIIGAYIHIWFKSKFVNDEIDVMEMFDTIEYVGITHSQDDDIEGNIRYQRLRKILVEAVLEWNEMIKVAHAKLMRP